MPPINNPFSVDATSAQQAHSSFAASALGVGVHRVVGGRVAPGHVIPAAQVRNNVSDSGVLDLDAEIAAQPVELRERNRLACPHCGWASYIRSSRQMTKLTREYSYGCSNFECGHTFVVNAEIVRTVSPSATPDPSVNLPLSTHVRRDLLRAQMDYARPADHQPVNSNPVTGDLFGALPPPKPA